MKKITIILIRKAFPKASDKSIVFFYGFLCAVIAVLYPIAKELWDAETIYTADSIDWKHIWTTHGPAIAAAIASYWNMSKAADLIPEFLEDAPLSISAIQVPIPKPSTSEDNERKGDKSQ